MSLYPVHHGPVEIPLHKMYDDTHMSIRNFFLILKAIAKAVTMKISSVFDSINGVCIVSLKGNYHQAEDVQVVQKYVAERYHEDGYTRFLIDLNEVDVSVGISSIYDAGNPQGEVVSSLRQPKTAFFHRIAGEKMRFFENVALNRGFNIKTFNDYDKAIDWLTSGSIVE
jgi:hypothetical protein